MGVCGSQVKPEATKQEVREQRKQAFKNLEPRAFVECNLESLKFNIGLLQRNAELMIVLSNDAYGHGAVQCAQLAVSLDVDAFCVSTVAEGIALREGGVTPQLAKVLVTSEPMSLELPAYMGMGLGVLVTCRRAADYIKEFAEHYEGKRELNVYVLVDAAGTGLGILPKDVFRCVKGLLKRSCVRFQGLMLRTIDDIVNGEYPRIDLRKFEDAVLQLTDKDIDIPSIMMENNQSILDEWDSKCRAIGDKLNSTKVYARCSVETFGFKPRDSELPLKKCMALKAQIRDIRMVERGQWIGLNGWQAPIDSFVAVVSCGFADGYPQCNDEKPWVRIKGQNSWNTYNVVEICSDHMLVHLGSAKSEPDCDRGDLAVLFAPQGTDPDAMRFSRLCDDSDSDATQVLCHISAVCTKRWISTGLTRRNTLSKMSVKKKPKEKSPEEEESVEESESTEKRKPKKKKKKKKKKSKTKH